MSCAYTTIGRQKTLLNYGSKVP